MMDNSMLDLFKMEVEQQTAVLNASLLALEQSLEAAEQLEAAMRASHSIKGAARLMDFQPVVKLAHVMEDCFVAAQQGSLHLTSSAIDVLLKGMDAVAQMAAHEQLADGWLALHQPEYDALLAALQNVLVGAGNEPRADVSGPVVIAPGKDAPVEPPAHVAADVPMADMSLLELFRMEVEQQSKILTEGLLALEQDPASPERLEPLMRAAHSIKGAARLVDVQGVVRIAHVLEDGFVAAQKGQILLTPDQIDVQLKTVDVIQAIALGEQTWGQWLAEHQAEYDELIASLEGILKGESHVRKPPPAATVEAPPAASIPAAPRQSEAVRPAAEGKKTQAGKERVLRISADQINRLMGLAGESMVESRWLYPFSGSLQRLKRQQTDLVRVLDVLRDRLENDEASNGVRGLVRQAQRQAEYCREILADRLSELEAFDRRATNLASRLHREVIVSRMRPFGDGIHGFPRMVRDVARTLNKDVQLVIEGEATMVDREILDKIEAPLNHLLRNAIDHGIESPEDRIAAGKPAKGTIKLHAYHHAGLLSITVQDDGRGVDLERLRRKIVEKKLVDTEMAASLSEPELMDFLFLPSFSTRDNVSEISGRGVGLDVVHDVVQEMRGMVRATSELGKGTRFQMQLPLTLSVIPALLVDVGGEPYAFPLARIERILRVDPATIEEAEGNQFINMDGRNIGLVDAGQVLALEVGRSRDSTLLQVIVLGDRGDFYGIVVDKFLGERELVVQVLPAQLGKVQDISAAALMEDGSPLLIIDVDDMIRSIEKILKVTRISRIVREMAAGQDDRSKQILVVDDSLTVREVERKLLEGLGYAVDVAVDGMDGLNALRAKRYDLLISDIDMPRMNGIDLVRSVRQDPSLKSIPVVIVSYKDREEDRIKGMEAGADYYLTKGSFHDEGLRNAVRDLIGEATA